MLGLGVLTDRHSCFEIVLSLMRGAGTADCRFEHETQIPFGRVFPQTRPATRQEETMKRVRDRVGGLDVHRGSVMVCARVVDAGEIVEDKQRLSTTSPVCPSWAGGCWIAGSRQWRWKRVCIGSRSTTPWRVCLRSVAG